MSGDQAAPAARVGGAPAGDGWLDEQEQRTWRAWLRASELLQASLEAQLQRDAGLPLTYYVVLAMLSEAPDRTLRMSDLACAANASPSRLSHAVGRLEARGWVSRHPAPGDGRGTLATLTAAGWELLQAQAPGHVAAVRRGLFGALRSDQVRELGDALAAVVAGLESADLPAAEGCPPTSTAVRGHAVGGGLQSG